ncbi:MAG: hypothetical protein IK088_06245 [Lachnospiraceae bacterium]|nr:hypothetical protein [Lachnospiraceae bacterium]
MKRDYETPAIELVCFDESDVVCTSGGMNSGGEYNPGQGGEGTTRW